MHKLFCTGTIHVDHSIALAQKKKFVSNAHTHTCIHIHTHTRMHTHTCTHAYTHTHACIHTHARIHTHTQSRRIHQTLPMETISKSALCFTHQNDTL